MNNSNVKLMSAFALVAMMASVVSPITNAFAATNDPEFALALNWAHETGLTSYSTEEAFMPNATLTREQAAKFLGQFGSEVLGLEVDSTANCTFSDAAAMDTTLVPYVAQACGQGLLKGSNGKFMPTTSMTKAQFVTALVRGLNGDVMDESTSPWYLNYCTWAQENGITKETNCSALDRSLTRYEALLMLYRGRTAGDDVVVDPTDEGTGSTDTTVTTGSTVAGDVSINISDETPGVQYVPGTGNNIQALKFDVTAGKSAVKISALNFKLAGLVNRNNVQISVVDENGVRLSTERSFNTNFEALVTANTSAGITVPANTTKSFYAVVKTMGSVNERFVVSIENAAAVSASATVGGTFPITSNQVNTTQYSSQNIEFDAERTAAATGTISDKLYVGNTAKQLGKFTLNTSSSNSKDVTVKNIRFKSTDTVEGVLSNLTLEVNGVNVAKSVVVDGKFVTFVVNDYVIPYGNSKTFYVKGDVIGGEKNDNVQFFLDSASDIVALENGTNASVSVTTKQTYLKPYTIVEGDNYISRTDGLTSNRNVPSDANKILALKANINATSEMSVDKINVKYAGSATGTTIEAVQLYVNGLLVDEISSFPNATAGTLSFSFYGNLNAGANSVEVRMDTRKEAIDGQNIKFSIDSNSLVGAEYTATSNSVVSTDVSGTADGVYLIVRKAAVESISKTYVANPQIAIREGDITAIKFAIKANNVRDLSVRGFTLNMSGVNTNGGAQDATLYVAGATGAIDSESFSKGNSVTFNGLNVTIPAATSKEFWVLVKTTVDLPSASTSDIQFYVNGFDIEDSEGNTAGLNGITSVYGNVIDVKAGLEVFGNRTSATQSTIIPASSTDSVTVGTFELKSDYADALVEEITLVNLKSSFTPTTVSAANVVNQIEQSSNGAVVDLYQGSTLVGQAQLLDGIAYIDLATPVTIKGGSTAIFTAKVKSNTTITSAGDTNKAIRLGVLNPGSLGNGTTQTLISAVGNSISATGSFTNLVFNEHRLRATTLTFADQANPDTITNNIYNVAVGAQKEIFKTNVTANGSKSAQIYQLTFSHAFTGVTVSGYQLKVDTNVLTSTDALCVPSGSKVTCTFGGAYSNGLTVSAGSSSSISLMATVSPVNVGTNNAAYVTTSISEGTTTDFNMYNAASAAAAGASVVWSDNAEPNVTPTSIDWFTDAGVEKLPSNAWTFSKN